MVSPVDILDRHPLPLFETVEVREMGVAVARNNARAFLTGFRGSIEVARCEGQVASGGTGENDVPGSVGEDQAGNRPTVCPGPRFHLQINLAGPIPSSFEQQLGEVGLGENPATPRALHDPRDEQ
jgi:hypothetical protein